MKKNEIRKHWWIIFAGFFSLIISFLWFRNGLVKATGESGLFFSILQRQLDLSISTWSDSTIGETPFSFNGSIPLLVVLYLLNLILPNYIVQALFFSLCIFLAIVGVGGILKIVKPNTSQLVLVLSGIGYCFNPYSIVFIWNRFLYNYTFAYCFVPFVLLLYLYYIKSPNLKRLLFLFLTCLFGSFAFTGIAYLLVFMLIVFFTSFYILVKSKDKIRSMVTIVFAGSCIVVSQFFWLLPFYAGNRLGVGQSTSFFSEQGNLNTTMKLSEYYGGILNKLTMIRGDMSALAYEGVPWAVWYSKSLVTTTAFISVLFIVVGLFALFKFKLRHKWFLAFSFIASLLFVNGTALPLSNLYLLLYKVSPVLGALRNPYEKAGFAFYILAFLIWGLLLSMLNDRKSKGPFLLMVVSSIIWWSVIAAPIFDGRVFTYKHATSNDPKVGFSVDVPAYYSDLSSHIDSDPRLTRVLALPITGEGVVHKWNPGYDGVESYNGLLNKSAISLDTTTGQLPQIAKYIKSAETQEILSASRVLNVSDLVLRGDLVMPVDSPTSEQLASSVSNFAENFDSKTDFGGSLISSYKLNNSEVYPRLYATDDELITSVNKVIFAPGVIGDKSTSINSNSVSPDIYFPTTSFVEQIDVVRPSYEVNQLIPLPHVSHQRNSRFYPLVRIREDFWKLTNGFELMPITMTLSFKRLVEIEPFVGDDTDSSDLKEALLDYETSIDDLIKEAKFQIANDGGNRPFWELVMTSHIRRLEEYFARSNSKKDLIGKTIEVIKQKVYDSNVFPLFDNLINGDKEKQVLYRYIFDEVENGEYNLKLKSRSGTLDFVGSIQSNEKVDLVKNNGSESVSIPLKIDQKKNEVRVQVSTKSDLIFDQEQSLSSLSSEKKKMRFGIPANVGQGQLLLSFRYKIVRGNGPRVDVYRSINESKPLISERYPTDTYDFDWKYKTISIPTNSSTGDLYVDFIAEPSNDCQEVNPYDLECKNLAYREVYDRHTDFIIDDLVATFQPKLEVLLESSGRKGAKEYEVRPLRFTRLNPSMYLVDVQSDNSNIVLLEQFHTGWQFYRHNGSVDGQTQFNYENKNVSELKNSISIINEVILSVKTFFQKPVYGKDNQSVAHGYANAWRDVDSGTYLLQFNPQRLFYLGFIATFVMSVSLFLIAFFYEKKN